MLLCMSEGLRKNDLCLQRPTDVRIRPPKHTFERYVKGKGRRKGEMDGKVGKYFRYQRFWPTRTGNALASREIPGATTLASSARKLGLKS